METTGEPHLERLDTLSPTWLDQFYDAYPRIEEEFSEALNESLEPRGPDVLYDLVEAFALPAGSSALDVGCGEGKHSFQLAERFLFTVTGIDPVARHVELAQAELATRTSTNADLGRSVCFALGSAEELPFDAETADLVWCRDVLLHVSDLDRAYAEFRRVLRRNGRALIYQMFGTERLEPHEASWLWKTMGVVPANADPARTEAAISAAGLHVDDCIDLSSEWGEWREERTGQNSRHMLHAARLLRDPQRYIAQFGERAYETMLGDCLWHIYAMIGKLDRRVYLLSKP